MIGFPELHAQHAFKVCMALPMCLPYLRQQHLAAAQRTAPAHVARQPCVPCMCPHPRKLSALRCECFSSKDSTQGGEAHLLAETPACTLSRCTTQSLRAPRPAPAQHLPLCRSGISHNDPKISRGRATGHMSHRSWGSAQTPLSSKSRKQLPRVEFLKGGADALERLRTS